MLLKILALLKDEKSITVSQLYSIVEKSKSESEFDEKIKPYIKSSPEDFKAKWADYGVGSTKYDIWEVLLKNFFSDSVVNGIQLATKVKQADIVNNVEAAEKIYKEVALDLSSSGFTYGDNIHKAIQDSVKKVINNNRVKYQHGFKVKEVNQDIQTETVDYHAQPVVKVTNGAQALKNISSSEVKVILSDIYKTRHIYKIETEKSNRWFYSMYESFLRMLFKYEMRTFNEEFKGRVQVSIEEHVSAKHTKIDTVMYSLLTDFILPGISKDNIKEFQQALFFISDDKQHNNSTPIFSQKKTEDGFLGNFGTQRTFAKGKTATEKYDKMVRGLLGTTKLYHYLTKAGYSAYSINPMIFHFELDDPSNKFVDLLEVVECNNIYTEVVEKYDLWTPMYQFRAICSKKDGRLLLINKQQEVLIENRKKIMMDQLSQTVTNVTSKKTSSSYAVMHFMDVGLQINIFEMAKAIHEGNNPLHYIFRGEALEWDPEDPEENVDMEVFIPFINYAVGADCSDFADFKMDNDRLLQLKDVCTTELKLLLDDITSMDVQKQVKILLALEAFVNAFIEFLDEFGRRYYKGLNVSEVEYSAFLLEHPLFEPLHSVVDPTDKDSSRYEVELNVMHSLLKVYYPDITKQDIKDFLHREYQCVTYANLVLYLKSRTFKDITRNFCSAKSNLFSLSDQGINIRLNSQEIMEALANGEPLLYEKVFAERFAGVPKDSLGYLVKDEGSKTELYSVIIENNRIGALHSQGHYIFTDKTSRPWGKD